jgi:O-antigen/teichoic acid export membrane protein
VTPPPTPTDAADPGPYAGRVEASRGGLRQLAARGTIVTAVFMIALAALGFLKGFAVAAFLTAAQFGVWGLLVATLGTLGRLKQVGIGDKYVQQDEADQELAFQRAFTLEVLMNGGLLVVAVAALPLYALIADQPQILLPGFLLAATIPAVALRAPIWIFYRQMRFVRQRSLQAIEPVVAFVLTIPLAIAGLGFWSLVIGLFVGRWASALATVKTAPYPLRLRFDKATTRDYFSFSWPLFAQSVAGLLIPQVAVLVGEWKLGVAGAGVIALAGSVVVFADRVDAIVTQSLYPAVCAVRNRLDLLHEAFIKSNRLALMWGFPFGVAVALFAPDLIAYVLGERWRAAVGLLQIWGLVAAVNHIGFNWTAFYRATGNTAPIAVVTAIGFVTLAVSILPLVDRLGLQGFGLALALMASVVLVARGYFLAKLFHGFKLVTHALRAMAPTVPAVAVTLAVRALTGERTLGLAAAELVLYLGVTAAATVLLEGALLREAAGYLRRRARPRATATA